LPECRVGSELTFDRHDEMAGNAGKNQRPFIDLHEELTTTLQLKLIEYVKSLLDPIDNAPAGDHRLPNIEGAGSQVAGWAAVQIVPDTGPRAGPVADRLPNREGSGTKSAARSAARSKYHEIATEDGWPVMPEVMEDDLKESLEDLLRGYLTAQYSESCPNMSRTPVITSIIRTCIGTQEGTTSI
jgi:hypothetical protein